MHFDAHAEAYERFRPPYPGALWQRLRELDVLRTGVRVLELGAGTGQATRPLVEAGATVTAVEPGDALAERLRRRVPEARVLTATAEEVVVPDSGFDAAVVATAVHWLDLNIVVPKLHRALVPGGQLAVWRTVFEEPRVPTDFRERISAIVARRQRPRPTSDLETSLRTRQLTASGHFIERWSEAFRWSVELDIGHVRGLFRTFSDWTAEEVEAAAQAANDLGGRVVEHCVTPLLVLDRADVPE